MRHAALATALSLIFCLYGIPSLPGQDLDFCYLSPLPGSEYINPEQVIALKTGYPFDHFSLTRFSCSITGTVSGTISCSKELSPDGITLFIRPDYNFATGETVSVIIGDGLETESGIGIAVTRFDFTVRKFDPPLMQADREEITAGAGNLTSFPEDVEEARRIAREQNDLPPDFPAPVGVIYGETNEDYIFLTPNARVSSQYSNYLVICDKYGTPVFYRKLNRTYNDFMPLPNGLLAYGRNEQPNSILEKYLLMDSTYTLVDSVAAGNGYFLDSHDIECLPDGHYLILIYDPQIVDMSQIIPGGNPNATVVGLVIQEVDLDQNVYFQWRSWDHFEITDATDDIILTSFYIDYVHGNALAVDANGDILLSSRHLDEITKIDHVTGEVIWRFGLLSENNQFTILNDPDGFSHQHDVRVRSNGNITVFDNGNLRLPQYSQAKEYMIDEETMTATQVWSYRHTPDIFAQMTGGYEHLSTEKNMIGWGTNYPIAATETDMNGSSTFELYLPDSVVSYRAQRHPWETSLFTTPQVRDFGNLSGYPEGKEKYLPVTNSSSHAIYISSCNLMTEAFYMNSQLPLLIPPGQTINLKVVFEAGSEGTYQDIITLNYDNNNLTTTERIARQVSLEGVWNDELPAVFFDPEYGSIDTDPGLPVIVVFSEPVRHAFGNEILAEDIPDIFEFKNAESEEEEAFTGTISSDKQTMTLYPSSPLGGETGYKVVLLPNKVADYQGHVITYHEITFFTTGQAVGLGKPGETDGILVYPSPFSDKVILRNERNLQGEIILYQVSGSTVKTQKLAGGLNVIGTKRLAAGTYVLKVTFSDGTIYSRKLIKK